MAFIGHPAHETDEQATARLAAAPEGSINHQLSKLPVTVREWPLGFVLWLPRVGVAVVPFEYRNPGWNCIVVKGNEAYGVGGYSLSISDDEIRRAERIIL